MPHNLRDEPENHPMWVTSMMAETLRILQRRARDEDDIALIERALEEYESLWKRTTGKPTP